MDRDRLNQIEDTALNAWPSPRQMLYDGWLLRFTGGESKRVNSVNVRYPSNLPFDEKIAACELAYARQGLPVMFRLPEPFAPTELHQALEAAGFHSFDPTFVFGRELSKGEQTLPSHVTFKAMTLADFVRLRAELSDTSLVKWDVYKIILSLIVPEKIMLGLFVDDRLVSCGMGVVEGDLLGFFSIYTRQGERRRGYGRAAMLALTNWGVERGASFGYLQVEGHNAPALAMYEKMGFERCYQYVYYKKQGLDIRRLGN